MRKIAIGIDPGLAGAVGVLIDGMFYSVETMPIEKKKSGKAQVDVAALDRLAYNLKAGRKRGDRVAVALELVQAMPAIGNARKPAMGSSFSMGDSFGCARYFAYSLEAPVHLVLPAAWKKAMGLTKDKDYSLAQARRLFPAAYEFLKLKKDDGKAEALLLAQYIHDRCL